MYEELFATILTKEELQKFLTKLAELDDALYSLKTSVQDSLNTFLPFDKKDLFLSLCQKNNVVLNNPQSVKDCIKIIQSEAKQLPILTISIAFTPSEEQLYEMSAWFTGRMGRKYLFSVLVDHSLVGGAIITSNGLYKDFTLKRYLKENPTMLGKSDQKASQ